MSRFNLKKTFEKAHERSPSHRERFSSTSNGHIHRGVIFAFVCLMMVVVLCTVMVNSSLSRTFAYGDGVNGIGIGIFWNQDCTNRTVSLNWRAIEPGSNTTLTVYIRNEDDSPANLWLATSNWAPSDALDFMTLSWNYSGQILNPYQVIPLELNLNVSSSITGISQFSFTTTITTTN